jgi:hypothetical protein
MTITTLPPAPSRAEPSTFSAKGDALLGALATFVSEANALGVALNLASTTSTSTTSLAIAIASKMLTVNTSKSYQPGMSVKIAYTTDPDKWMHGDVTSYNPVTGTLMVNVTTILGTGTYAVWTVTLSAPRGAAGADGADGADGAPGSNAWTQTTGTFTATPASTSTLTMTTDLTAYIYVGMSLAYIIGGTSYFGRVGAMASNLLTVNGAPLGGDVTALYYGGGTVRQVVVIIPDFYEDASSTGLIVADLRSSLTWTLPVSYCVHYKVYSDVADSGDDGKVSVRINATELNTSAGGLTIAADKTWYSTVVNIATAAYDINPGEAVEVTSVKGTTGDACDLTVMMFFVTP